MHKKEEVMEFNHLRLDEFEEHGSDLENVIELEITIFESFPENLPDDYISQDDYLQKELERQEQENINRQHQPRIP
jgi:hypothetical protein